MKSVSLRIALVVAALGATAAIATAGAKYGYPVQIYGNDASGALGSARNSTDSMQFIGCDTTSREVGGTDGVCWARDAAGNSRSCYSADPAIVTAMRTISGDSYVWFRASASGTCSFVKIDNYSYLAAH